MASNSTPASTTVKVSAQTGAAKDDIFLGISEDSSSQNLNVLANDPGSAAFWSIDQNALNAPAGSQQPQYLNTVTLASGAKLSINADSTVHYVGAAALQSLAEGELFTDSFIYTIRMGNGALSTAKASVQIVGKNDVATFSGDKAGSLTEDQSGVIGKLIVSDVDHDQSAMQAVALTGSNGNLSIDTAGNWAYNLTRDMNYLQAGEKVTEVFTVKSVDGTGQAISITISGVNDAAVFSGTATGSVQEDGVLNANGVLSVSDADHDQSAFAGTGNLNGTYGNFTFDLHSGVWTYSLNNDASDVQALGSGQSVQDTLLVSSIDGSITQVVVNIGGADEPVVVIANPESKWNVNKQNVTLAGGGLQGRVDYTFSDDTHGIAKITGFDSNDTLHYAGIDKETAFIQLVDTNDDGVNDSTQLNFNYDQGHATVHLDVVLVGYTGFTADQLFNNQA